MFEDMCCRQMPNVLLLVNKSTVDWFDVVSTFIKRNGYALVG